MNMVLGVFIIRVFFFLTLQESENGLYAKQPTQKLTYDVGDGPFCIFPLPRSIIEHQRSNCCNSIAWATLKVTPLFESFERIKSFASPNLTTL